MNAALFARVKAVYERRTRLALTAEQARLLEETYKDFVRGGADLAADKQARLRQINEELSVLSVKFGENVLKENNAFELVIDNEADLAGLPPAVRTGAAEAATERGKPGKWVFTLHKPSLIPFLQYSERRDLREKMFKAYIERGTHGNELDNRRLASRQAALRVERANLLGYKTHADYVLEKNMAKTPAAVYEFLGKLWTPALARAKAEAADMQAMIRAGRRGLQASSPGTGGITPKRSRRAKYDLDDTALRPYFPLENVRDGAFMVATKLYGITFTERTDIPKYHEDVRVFEVKDADGSHLAVLYVDYYPRASKQGGAWMNNFREQSIRDGKDIRPIISNNGNFSKPTAGEPALISYEEALTLFHEFGHALHGILTRCAYESLSGTNVPRDFVELGSQIMENWAGRPRGPQDVRPALQDGRAHPGRAAREDAEEPALQPGLRDGRVPGRLVPGHGLAHARRAQGASTRPRSTPRRWPGSASSPRSSAAISAPISATSSAAAIRRAITATSGPRSSIPTPSRPSRRRASSTGPRPSPSGGTSSSAAARRSPWSSTSASAAASRGSSRC